MSSNFPLVSIIIPYYNHKNFIEKTLDSIVEDSYLNKEIILINDGSSDKDDSKIIDWISSHPDININYIKRENKGLTRTLNEMIHMSNGKYILVCASDDYLINDTIGKRIEVLEKNPKKMLLLSDNIVVDDDNNILYESNLFSRSKHRLDYYSSDNSLISTIINKWTLAGACYIVDKNIFKEVGYYNENLIVEDWDFFLRVASKKLILFYNEKVSAYRLHDTNTSSSGEFSMKMYENQTLVSKKAISFFSFPFNLMMLRRHIKYSIKLRKMKELFPYNLTIWKFYKRIKSKG